MRATTLLVKLLAVTAMFVSAVRLEHGDLVVPVRPRWHKPRCGKCGKRAPGYDTSPKPRYWRALPFGSFGVWLEYSVRRVQCTRCGIHVEAVPWAAFGSRFTLSFEEMVGYLAQLTDKTTVTELLGLSWRAVGHIVERLVGERLDPARLDALRRIGIDEFSYRKRHKYITVVVDHDRQHVVWAGKGHGAETLKAFFDLLGPERAAKIELVTMDMAGGYLSAVRDKLPQAQVIFDRFHVQRLASDAVDKVRRELWREEQGTPEGDAIKGSRFSLLKNPWNLTATERGRLSDVQRSNKPLYRAYLLKETLARVLDYRQLKRATDLLAEWLGWASRSRLAPFVKTARTIRKHTAGILAYIRERLTNGIVEGINNRLRVIARQAYGFHSAQALIGMLYLCCGGIQHSPPLPGTTH